MSSSGQHESGKEHLDRVFWLRKFKATSRWEQQCAGGKEDQACCNGQHASSTKVWQKNGQSREEREQKLYIGFVLSPAKDEPSHKSNGPCLWLREPKPGECSVVKQHSQHGSGCCAGFQIARPFGPTKRASKDGAVEPGIPCSDTQELECTSRPFCAFVFFFFF